MFVIAAALVAALTNSPAFAQSEAARAPQTDQTVPVARGARMSVEAFAGEVIVRGWDRDAIRVQARHSSRTRVSVRTVPTGVSIRATGSYGPGGAVDYEINVPSWMPVKIDGQYAYISIEGTQSEITAETVRGDIVIKGGGTFVSAKSVEGDVSVEGTRGRVTVNSINQGVSVTGVNGDVLAETVNGPIKLARIDSENVEAGSVNGHITYDGTAATRGKYRFSTHNGNIVVSVPETASATFSVRTYNGTMNTNLPLQKTGDVPRGRRATYTLGSGSAEFELESFGGTIHLRRPAQGTAAKSKEKD